MADNTSIEGILTRGLKSALEGTEIKDGKLRVVIDTGEIFLDIEDTSGSLTRKQLASDIIKDKTEQEIRNTLAPLPLFYYAKDTYKLMYYNGTVWVVIGDNVSYATNAGTATYAVDAGNIDWSNISNKPSAYTPITHNHGTADIVDLSDTIVATKVNNAANADVADSANSVAWDNVSNKPNTFTPSSHNHSTEDITDLSDTIVATKVDNATNADTATYAESAGTIAWGNVTNKPTSMAHAEVADSANSVAWGNVSNKPTSMAHANTADTADFATTSESANTVDWSGITNKPTNFTDVVNDVVTGNTNGTININKNGTTAEVSVAGLGSAAYQESNTFAQASHNHTTAQITDLSSTIKDTKVYNAVNADTATYAESAGTANSDSDGNTFQSNYAASLSINGSDITLKSKNNTELSTITVPGISYEAGAGLSLNGSTFSNAGVREIDLNGNKLNINTNGSTVDLTIPYATNADTANYSTSADTANSANSVDWSGVTNKPSSIDHSTNADTATYAESAGSVAWEDVSEKPSSFTPSTHNHTTAQITDLSSTIKATKVDNATNADTATYAESAGSISWTNVSGKPETFTPSAHNHSTTEITDLSDTIVATKVNNADTADYASIAEKDDANHTISEYFAPKASPALTGEPTTPTPVSGDDSKKIANTEFVQKTVASAIGSITGIAYLVVNELPSTGETGTIYLVPKSASEDNNYYDEYIWIVSTTSYEKIGDTQVDLSQYVNNVTTNGTGNAITGVTKSGDGVTFTKGSTFLTDHPPITMGTDTTSSDTPSFGGTFTTIDGVTKDANGHITKVNTKTVSIPNSTATSTAAGLVPKHNDSVSEYLRGDNTWATLSNSHNHTTANITNLSSTIINTKVNNAGTADYSTSAGNIPVDPSSTSNINIWISTT